MLYRKYRCTSKYQLKYELQLVCVIPYCNAIKLLLQKMYSNPSRILNYAPEYLLD